MNLKTLLFVLLGLLNVHGVIAQDEINYMHRSLVKTLRKGGGSSRSSVKEIILPDSILKSNQVRGKYFIINDKNVKQYKYIYVGRVNSCRAGGCSLSGKAGLGAPEYFDYYILFDKNKKVQAVKVFNYQATHGHEIAAKGWLKQFVGHDGSESLRVDKNIDAISGATISVYAITRDIELKTKLLGNF